VRFILFTLILLLASVCSAATFYVPQDSPTIQGAINMAGNGDTVMIAAGTYTGSGNRDLIIDSKAIALIGSGATQTVIDCQADAWDEHRGIQVLYTPPGQTTLVASLQIRNGYGPETSFYSPHADEYHSASIGGAIHAREADLHVFGCSFRSNRSNLFGGSVFCDSTDVFIQQCSFDTSTTYGWGGAIAHYGNRLMVSSSNFRHCLNYFIQGSGIYSESDSVKVESCSFVNTAQAILITANSVIENCLFSQCYVTTTSGNIVRFYGPVSIRSCLFYRNTALKQILASDEFPLAIECTNLYGNHGNQWEGLGFYANKYGNISADPRFIDTLDFGLGVYSSSPCTPANNECSEWIGPLHIGYYNRPWIVAENGSYVTGDGTAANPLASIGAAIDSSRNWDTVLVMDGTYMEAISPEGKPITVASQFLNDGDSARILSTVVNGSGLQGDSASVVWVHDREDSNTALIGLTFSGGSGTVMDIDGHCSIRVGGGLILDNSNPLIRDCRFVSNSAQLGGGVAIVDATYEGLDSCVIQANDATIGGGVAIINSNVSLGTAEICANLSSGLYAENTQIYLDGTVVAGNDGDAVSMKLSWGQLANCAIYGNNGSAIRAEQMSTSVVNTTIANNNSSFGAVVCSSATVNLERSILMGTKVGPSANCIDPTSSITAFCSDIYLNEGGDWVGCLAGFEGILGNISLDPDFCNASGSNFSLNIGSPCLPLYNSCNVQMGAYGQGCEDFLNGDCNQSGIVDLDDIIFLLAYIFSGGPNPIPFEAGDVNSSGAIDVDDAVYLINYVFSGGPAPLTNP